MRLPPTLKQFRKNVMPENVSWGIMLMEEIYESEKPDIEDMLIDAIESEDIENTDQAIQLFALNIVENRMLENYEACKEALKWLGK